MKKVIFVLWHVSGKGGTESVVQTVARQLASDSEYLPKVYIMGDTESYEWLQGITYDFSPFIKSKWFRVFPYFCKLLKYVKNEKPDIVISLSPMICLFLNIIRKITHLKFPIVSWIHFSLDANKMKKKWLKFADAHLAISSGIRDQLVRIGVNKQLIHMVYNPVLKTDVLIPRPTRNPIFIYVGRITFEGQKRLKDLFDALVEVHKPWVLKIIGSGEDLQKCKNYVRYIGINDRITWYGWQQNPWSVVDEATALVLTSDYEGFGMVLAEAISRGVYCISSDCDVGPSDIIVSGVNGELYHKRNLHALKDKLIEVAENRNLPVQARMKESIDKFYLENYFSNLKYSLMNIEKFCKQSKHNEYVKRG